MALCRRAAIRLLLRVFSVYGLNRVCFRCDLASDVCDGDDDGDGVVEFEFNTCGANRTLFRGMINCLRVLIARSMLFVCMNRSLASTKSRLTIESGNAIRVDKTCKSTLVLPSTSSSSISLSSACNSGAM